MSAEPKPYVLPQLRHIGSGASIGALAGVVAGLWSAPLSLLVAFFWLSVSSPSAQWSPLLGLLITMLVYATFVGCVVGGMLGGLAGGAIYIVLCPWLRPERWPAMEAALKTGMKRGLLIGHVIAAMVPVAAFGPWGKFLTSWIDFRSMTDWLIYGWFALVPGAFVLGGFINVARLMGAVEED